MSAFASRLVVGAIGLPVVLGIVWLGGWWLFGLLACAGLIALHEFYSIARPLRPLVLAGYAGATATLLAAKLGGPYWLAGGLASTLAFAFLLALLAETRQSATVAIGATVLGVVWIGVGLAHIQLLREHLGPHERLAVLTVLLAVFADDTAAYFSGRLVGRHKLAPVLSPGKTWEGFVVGSIVCVLVTFFALYDDKNDFLNVWQALVLGCVIAVSEAAGDLFESMLKRDMQVKDTGHLLGGHGGVLDRIDALLFASAAAFYLVLGFGYS